MSIVTGENLSDALGAFKNRFIKQPDWNKNTDTESDFVKNRTHWKDTLGSSYASDMTFLQLYSGVNTDDGGIMESYEFGYARFDVVNQDPEAFYDRQFSRNTESEYPLEGTITWYDEMETGWYELCDDDSNVIAILVTDEYQGQNTYFYTVDEDMRPSSYTATTGLYVINAIYDSEIQIEETFDFFIDVETIYHTLDKHYLEPVEWDEIENKTHGVLTTVPETITVEHDDFTDDGEFCTAEFYDSYTTGFRKFTLIYDDGYTEEWYGTMKIKKYNSNEFVECDEGVPMQEPGDLLIYGNPHLYNSVYEDNGDWYVMYNEITSQDFGTWHAKMGSENMYLDYLISMDILDIGEIKKLDKVFLPKDNGIRTNLEITDTLKIGNALIKFDSGKLKASLDDGTTWKTIVLS